MEIYRSIGLEGTIREHLSFLVGHPEMIGADTLSGQERFRTDLLAQVRPPEGLSPVDWAMIDQDELERVIRAAADDVAPSWFRSPRRATGSRRPCGTSPVVVSSASGPTT